MKKLLTGVVSICLFMTSCGGLGTVSSTGSSASSTDNVLGTLGAILSNGNTIGDVFSSVIGMDKLSKSQLVGTWNYNHPGVAFTSENLLARAGGEAAANQIEQRLSPYYQRMGISSGNTYITFKADGSFSAKVDGKAWNGTYTLNESTGELQMQGMFLNITGYAKRTTEGISLLFESKKVLTMMQTVAAMSGNSNIQQIGEICKNYDGIRMGFDLKK